MKAFKEMSFWESILLVITPFAIGGEYFIFVNGMHPAFHYVILGVSVTALVIKGFAKDKDGNGIVDFFDKKRKTKKTNDN